MRIIEEISLCCFVLFLLFPLPFIILHLLSPSHLVFFLSYLRFPLLLHSFLFPLHFTFHSLVLRLSTNICLSPLPFPPPLPSSHPFFSSLLFSSLLFSSLLFSSLSFYHVRCSISPRFAFTCRSYAASFSACMASYNPFRFPCLRSLK